MIESKIFRSCSEHKKFRSLSRHPNVYLSSQLIHDIAQPSPYIVMVIVVLVMIIVIMIAIIVTIEIFA